MQLYAFNEHNQIVSAPQADRHRDYSCLECRGTVRLRGGVHRQKHFFHLATTENCSQRRKGMVHLQIQCSIERLLPPGDCFLERRFPEIARIADVVWESEKIIFEVQCSGMSDKEASERNRDYQSVGYQVVWILHESRYNRWRVAAVEEALVGSPHYYTDMDAEGKGHIYDQWRWNAGGICRARLSPLTVDIRTPIRSFQEVESPLSLIKKRKEQWNLHFRGDLVDAAKQQASNAYFADYLSKAAEKESLFVERRQKRRFFTKPLHFLFRSYKILLKFFLERACR